MVRPVRTEGVNFQPQDFRAVRNWYARRTNKICSGNSGFPRRITIKVNAAGGIAVACRICILSGETEDRLKVFGAIRYPKLSVAYTIIRGMHTQSMKVSNIIYPDLILPVHFAQLEAAVDILRFEYEVRLVE